jgi:hypothetical protein
MMILPVEIMSTGWIYTNNVVCGMQQQEAKINQNSSPLVTALERGINGRTKLQTNVTKAALFLVQFNQKQNEPIKLF